MDFRNAIEAVRAFQATPAPAPSAAPVTDSRTPEQKAASDYYAELQREGEYSPEASAVSTTEQEIDDAFAASKKNAGNLKDVTAEYPGQPTVYASSKYPTKAYITGADGEKYVYVPLEFVQKGMIDKSTNEQYYTQEFLNGNTFKNAIQYQLPDSAGLSPMFAEQYKEPNKGFLWKQSDFEKVVAPGLAFYSLNTFPPIIGTGVPSVGPSAGDTVNHYYITQPNKVNSEYAQQFYTGATGDIMKGYSQV